MTLAEQVTSEHKCRRVATVCGFDETATATILNPVNADNKIFALTTERLTTAFSIFKS